jgi:hypothetical protein
MGKQVRAVVRDEAKGHVSASKGASVAVADMTDGDALGRAPNAMHDGHDLWLKVIKERSEKQH